MSSTTYFFVEKLENFCVDNLSHLEIWIYITKCVWMLVTWVGYGMGMLIIFNKVKKEAVTILIYRRNCGKSQKKNYFFSCFQYLSWFGYYCAVINLNSAHKFGIIFFSFFQDIQSCCYLLKLSVQSYKEKWDKSTVTFALRSYQLPSKNSCPQTASAINEWLSF